jgi:Zn finger protein HypA/HybF involved in hydrogenase expression
MDIEVKQLNCMRCGHKWYPRQTTVRICPHCKTPYWDIERTRKNQFVRRDEGKE